MGIAGRISEINRLRQKSLLFVNKKKQKNFVNWSAAAVVGAFQSEQKFFASFFQKRGFSPLLQPTDFICYRSGTDTSRTVPQ